MQSIGDRVRAGLQALEKQGRLSAETSDDAEWNRLASMIRASLKDVATRRSTSEDDVLTKAVLLASVIEREGEHDQRYRLAQSLIEEVAKLLPVLLEQNAQKEKGRKSREKPNGARQE